MDAIFFERHQCPYCGEWHEFEVDRSAGAQTYIEDCAVCCRPIEVRVRIEAGEWVLEVHRDDD
jgi:hypothetical protein